MNGLNRKTIPTVLSQPLYIALARMNTELQLIVYHIDGKCVWSVLVSALIRGYMCEHSGISLLLLSCILLLHKTHK